MDERHPVGSAAVGDGSLAFRDSSPQSSSLSFPDTHDPQLLSNIDVRRTRPIDSDGLALLWAEMQRHYGQPVNDVTASAAATAACRFSNNEFNPRTFVAINRNGEIIASLVLNVTFPARELTKSLYIRDLYVSKDWRRFGIARSLLRAAAALTIAEGFSSLDWTTDANNVGARSLYEEAGAREMTRVYYRLFGTDLELASRL